MISSLHVAHDVLVGEERITCICQGRAFDHSRLGAMHVDDTPEEMPPYSGLSFVDSQGVQVLTREQVIKKMAGSNFPWDDSSD